MSEFELQPRKIRNGIKQNTNLSRFQTYVEEKTQLRFENYWDFHRWSVENYPEFWKCVWHYFEIVHSEPYTEVFDKNGGFLDMKWFKGAKLNYAENVLKHRDSRTALITTSEEYEDNVELTSYEKLYAEVAKYASAMIASGIKKNDKIACCMSNRKEAILAFLATSSIGAIWSGALPMLGANAIISRFKLINPKILFSVDRFKHNRGENDMTEKLADIAKNLPSLEKIVIVPSKIDNFNNISTVAKSCFLHDFLSLADRGAKDQLNFEQVAFNHPLLISYTSGTTGSPKALIHSTGSFFATLRDCGLHSNLGREDVVLSISPVGWISWSILTHCLMLGLTLCLYEGQPFFLSPTYFWDLLENFKISYAFINPTALEEMKMRNYVPGNSHKLENLKFICLAGCPVKPQIYDFLARHLNENVHFASCYGSTELMGYCSGVDFRMPLYRGEVQCFALGVDAKTVDSEGNYVTGERANLVIKSPTPSHPNGLYNDSGNVKYHESYLERIPGHFDQKDECWINPITKGFIILGRSDETLKPKGARHSASEIYSAVWSNSECSKAIEDCICVSQYNAQLDERTVLFLKMAPGFRLTAELEKKLQEVISKELTSRHVPEVILETPGIPYNFSSKKMEIIVKMIVNNITPPNKDVVMNPESLEFYHDLPQLRNFSIEKQV